SGGGSPRPQPVKLAGSGASTTNAGFAMKEARKTLPAVSVALVRGDRVLLVRRARAPSQGFYAFPGGKVEVGETLEGAARRELLEETGLEAAGLRPVSEIFIEGGSEGHPVDYLLTIFSA